LKLILGVLKLISIITRTLMGYGHAARDGVRNTFTYLEDILFLSDYWRVERDVLLAYLLCTCLGLKNSRKGKPYFTIKLQKFAYSVSNE
jgi:hypothetical protein